MFELRRKRWIYDWPQLLKLWVKLRWSTINSYFTPQFKYMIFHIFKTKDCSINQEVWNLISIPRSAVFLITNKMTTGETLYRDCLHCIGNFCVTSLNIFLKEIISNNTNCRKQRFKFIWDTWKYQWNENDDKVLPVFPQFLWTLNFILSSSHEKWFLVFRATIYIFSFEKCKKVS